MLEVGCANMQHHIRNALKFGVAVVVAVNVFATDSPREIELVKQKALEAGATAAVESNHWALGGKGAKDLGQAVVTSCEKMRAQEARSSSCTRSSSASLRSSKSSAVRFPFSCYAALSSFLLTLLFT